MKKVLILMTSGGFGGIERLNFSLAEYFNKNGLPEDIFIRFLFLKREGFFYENFPYKLLEDSKVKGKDDFISFYKIFKKYDLIHFNSFMPTAFFVAKLLRKKIVYTVHGNFGFFRKFSFKEKVKRKIEKFAMKNVNFFIYNSEFSRKVFKNRYKISDILKEKVIHNFYSIDLKRCQGEKRKRNGGKYVGFLGRLVEVKKLDRFFEVSKKLFKKNSSFTFLIGGEGPLRGELEEMFSKESISKSVKFLGFVEDVTSFFKDLDFFIFPSANEAFGITALEAILSYTPVFLFSDGGGVVEIFKKCGGEIFICKNEEEMAHKILNFKNLDFDFGKFRECILKEFSIERYVSNLINIYRAV